MGGTLSSSSPLSALSPSPPARLRCRQKPPQPLAVSWSKLPGPCGSSAEPASQEHCWAFNIPRSGMLSLLTSRIPEDFGRGDSQECIERLLTREAGCRLVCLLGPFFLENWLFQGGTGAFYHRSELPLPEPWRSLERHGPRGRRWLPVSHLGTTLAWWTIVPGAQLCSADPSSPRAMAARPMGRLCSDLCKDNNN